MLDYLRTAGEGFTPPTSKAAQDELRAEADFYGLQGLVRMLRRLCVSSNHLMAVGKKGAALTGNRFAAAMLDVRDPNDFTVTFALGGSYRDARPMRTGPFIIGVAPLDTNIAQDWMSQHIYFPELPPPPQYITQYQFTAVSEAPLPAAVQEGLFFLCPCYEASYRGGGGRTIITRRHCYQFISGPRICKFQWHDWSGSAGFPQKVRMHFSRKAEGCTIEFRFSMEPGAPSWTFDLSEQGLSSAADFRPAIFFAERDLSATVEELVA